MRLTLPIFEVETRRLKETYKLLEGVEKYYGIDIEYAHQECCQVPEERRFRRALKGHRARITAKEQISLQVLEPCTRPGLPCQHEKEGSLGGRRARRRSVDYMREILNLKMHYPLST